MNCTTNVSPIPAGPRLTPYLAVSDAAEAIEFYIGVLGMREVSRMQMDDGRVGHAELAIGNARVFLSDEFPEMGVQGPNTRGGTTVSLHLYVADIDGVVVAALAAGATQHGETKDEFHGDRSAKLVDPWGHRWMLASRIEEVSAEEVERRFAAAGH